MIKKILVPQDGSEFGKSALDWGIYLAGKFDAGLIGIHVIDILSLEGPFLHDISGSLGFEPFLNFSTKMREVLEARGKTILSAFEEECENAGIRHERSLPVCVIPNEICEKANLADLVILGKRGVNAMFEYGLLGSTTESVLRRSPKPVFVVAERFAEPASPMLAYDGSPNAGKAMHSAAEWIKTLGLPLTVVNVSMEAEGAALKDAENYLKPYGIQADFVQLSGDPPLAIEKYYRENGRDLLFMGTSHHSRIVEMVLGSTTEHVMRNVAGPFFLER